MSIKYDPLGEPRVQGEWIVQEERRRGRGPRSRSRFRVTNRESGAMLVVTEDSLFDLTELLDDTCDDIEDRRTEMEQV